MEEVLREPSDFTTIVSGGTKDSKLGAVDGAGEWEPIDSDENVDEKDCDVDEVVGEDTSVVQTGSRSGENSRRERSFRT